MMTTDSINAEIIDAIKTHIDDPTAQNMIANNITDTLPQVMPNPWNHEYSMSDACRCIGMGVLISKKIDQEADWDTKTLDKYLKRQVDRML